MRSCLRFVQSLACALCSLVFGQEPPVPTFGTTVVIPSGLKGNIYNLRRNANRLPDFRKLKPVGAIYASALNVPPHDFKDGFPGVTDRFEWFAIEYAGRFWISNPDQYRFALTSDDGARLFVDDQLIIDGDGQHAPETREGSLKLGDGVHTIRVQYFQGPRFHVALVLEIAKRDEDYRIFSTDEFKPPSNLESWPDTSARK